MFEVKPIAESDAEGKADQAFKRIKDVMQVEEVPEIFCLMANVPVFVHDFFMNFRKSVLGEGQLDERSRLLIALAVAGQAGSQPWIQFLHELAAKKEISDQEIADAMAVASSNSMYNVLFKFRDIAGTDIFEGMPVGLRAHTFQGTSLNEQTVELINLTLSDINGCKPCTSGHVAKARDLNVPPEAIYEAIQCAATMMSGIQFLKSIGK
jgi:alkyl hydroperoxide reductase subunit D